MNKFIFCQVLVCVLTLLPLVLIHGVGQIGITFVIPLWLVGLFKREPQFNSVMWIIFGVHLFIALGTRDYMILYLFLAFMVGLLFGSIMGRLGTKVV